MTKIGCLDSTKMETTYHPSVTIACENITVITILILSGHPGGLFAATPRRGILLRLRQYLSILGIDFAQYLRSRVCGVSAAIPGAIDRRCSFQLM
jgi:hypothetical protein